MWLEAWLQIRPGRGGDELDPADYQRTRLGELAAEDKSSDFAAASAALTAARPAGFLPGQWLPFEYQYFFDSLDELSDYLDENEQLPLAGDELLERALETLARATAPVKLVLIQPVVAASLRKAA